MIIIQSEHPFVNFWYNFFGCFGFVLSTFLLLWDKEPSYVYEDPDKVAFNNELFYFTLCFFILAVGIAVFVIRYFICCGIKNRQSLQYNHGVKPAFDIKALNSNFRETIFVIVDAYKKQETDKRSFWFQIANELNGNIVRIGSIVLLIQAAYLMSEQRE